MQSTNRTLFPAGLIGLGVLFMWCCALLFWLGMTDGHGTLRQVVGYAGAALVSLSGLSILLYASRLEKDVAHLNELVSALSESSRDDSQGPTRLHLRGQAACVIVKD